MLSHIRKVEGELTGILQVSLFEGEEVGVFVDCHLRIAQASNRVRDLIGNKNVGGELVVVKVLYEVTTDES